jgi:methylthioribose-1-phosphate isomerase
MTLTLPHSRAETLRYDAERGLVLLLDPSAPGGWTACADPTALAQTVARDGTFDGRRRACAAAYGLALELHAQRGRPSDARRGAVIMTAERMLQSLPEPAVRALLPRVLARVDAALIAGQDAEALAISAVEQELRRGDRAAERSGRIAAELLDVRDRVLVHGGAGPAALALFAAACPEPQSCPALLLAEAPGAPWLEAVLRARGLAPQLVEAGAPPPFDLLVVAAERTALDGSVAALPGVAALVEQARRQDTPCYALGYDGPDPDAPDAEALQAGEIIPPALISAIITHRGTYRPEMIARHLGDGDAPLDLIPLS